MNLVEQLKRDEGVRLKPYTDTTGHTTIGVGRNLTDVGISMGEAEFLLENDITRTQVALVKALPWTSGLDEARLGAVLNMAFNLGVSGLLGFKTFLRELEAKNYLAAANAMLDSNWADQVGDRALRLSLQIETGQWH